MNITLPGDDSVTLLIVAFGLINGIFCFYVAYEKGYSPALWLFIGLFFNVLGLITLAALPISSTLATNRSDKYKTCTQCAEAIKNNAAICPHCKSAQSGEAELLDENVYCPQCGEKNSLTDNQRRTGVFVCHDCGQLIKLLEDQKA